MITREELLEWVEALPEGHPVCIVKEGDTLWAPRTGEELEIGHLPAGWDEDE